MANIKKYLILLLFIFGYGLFANDERITEFNQRALDSWKKDPSISLYYVEKSLDLNTEVINRDEYINSYYIKSLCYDALEDYEKVGICSTYAYNFIKENNYFYKESEFYTFYAGVLFDQGQYSELEELLGNKEVIDILDDSSLLYFNLLKIKRDLFFDKEGIEEQLKKSITVGKNLALNDVLGELYITYGDYSLEKDLTISRDLYQLALEMGIDKISVKALLKLGYVYREWESPYKSVNYLERALLISELLDDYGLTTEILDNLAEGYRQIGDYKNLSITKERLNYVYKKKFTFLIEEHRQNLDNNYFYQKLNMELERSKNDLSFSRLIILILAVVLIFLIIALSILQYKIRVYKIGEH